MRWADHQYVKTNHVHYLLQEVSKLYLMDRQATAEISGEVAQFLAFTMTELRSFLNMFYEEEEREADKIRTK